MRDSLARVQGELEGREPGFDPGDVERSSTQAESAQPSSPQPAATESAAPNDDSTAELSAAIAESANINLRELRVQQAQRQSEKSAAEVLGVAAAFRNIHDELVYNRIDAEDRKSRLMEQVAKPLQQIGETRFQAFDQKLAAMALAIKDQKDELAAVNGTIQDANALITDLNTVLEAMLDIESYNELIELVHALLEEQQELLEDTQKARAKSAADLLK
jgi:hypothetical protein